MAHTQKREASESPTAGRPRILDSKKHGYPTLAANTVDDVSGWLNDHFRNLRELMKNTEYKQNIQDVIDVLLYTAKILFQIGKVEDGSIREIWLASLHSKNYVEEMEFLLQYPDAYEKCRTQCYDAVMNEDWNLLLYNDMLRQAIGSLAPPVTAAEALAVEVAWKKIYKGYAHRVFWDFMHNNLLSHRHGSDKSAKTDDFTQYAHYTIIMQSSGMGKSRMIDELAKTHFVIPVNARSITASRVEDKQRIAYPPSDTNVSTWLTASPASREDTYRRCCAFIEALFLHTLEVIDRDLLPSLRSQDGAELSLSTVAALFREKMQEGTKFSQHGDYRTRFYSEVIRGATILHSDHGYQYITPSMLPRQLDGQQWIFPPERACNSLRQRLAQIASGSSGTDNVSENEVKQHYPLFTLAIDEAHTLSNQTSHDGSPDSPTKLSRAWSTFTEIRAIMRSLMRQPIFAVFMATTGTAGQLAIPSLQDPSDRIYTGELVPAETYGDLGFDHLAKKVSLLQGFNLRLVAEDDHMAHLGRPLFAALWDVKDQGVQESIIMKALSVLMRTGLPTGSQWSKSQLFACLSQRLALDFSRTSFVSQGYEQKQMESHTRICIRMQDNYETLDTITGSEPLLAEAAYHVMQSQSFRPAEALKLLLDSFSVHKGDRGELLSILLLTLARDGAVGPSTNQGHPVSGKRIFTVSQFLAQLLQKFKWENIRHHSDPHADVNVVEEFYNEFKHCYMHFNHFVKIHQYGVLRPDKLLGLSSRGSGILCANSQAGVDILLLGYEGEWASQVNQVLIMIQSKNDSHYTATPNQHTLDGMDPYKLGIWDIDDQAVEHQKPVIRIVFALAVKKENAKVTVQRRTNEYTLKTKGSPAHQIRYTSYDIWIAGLSSDILGPILPQENQVWEALLQASYGWEEPFRGISEQAANLRRSMDAGSAVHPAHWSQWIKTPEEEAKSQAQDAFGPILPNPQGLIPSKTMPTYGAGDGPAMRTSGSQSSSKGGSKSKANPEESSKGGSEGSSKKWAMGM